MLGTENQYIDKLPEEVSVITVIDKSVGAIVKSVNKSVSTEIRGSIKPDDEVTTADKATWVNLDSVEFGRLGLSGATDSKEYNKSVIKEIMKIADI